MALTATPAAANPLGDCFQRIAVAFHPHHHPHRVVAHTAIHRVHHVGPRLHPRPHRIAGSGPTRAYAHRTRYILRPIACATHPAEALMSPVPGAARPETPQQLLAELAGPPAATAPAVAADSAAVAPAPVEVVPETVGQPFFGFPGVFGGPGGGVFLPGGVTGVPGGPGGVFPPPPVVVGPPVIGVPPDVVPPIIPPIVPPEGPGGGQPPPIPPDVTPITPITPVTPPPGGPVGGVPEPASWALLLVGFFGLGGALRRGRALRA